MRRTLKMGLLVIGTTLMVGSFALSLFLQTRPQEPSGPNTNVTRTSVPNKTPTVTQNVTQTATLTSQAISSGHLREFSIQTPGSLPVAIAKGLDVSFWFTEEQGNTIGHVTSQGAITEYVIPTANCIPGGLTLGSDGNLWFVGFKPNTIWRMTTSGVITGTFPIPTNGSGTETIIAGPDGNVWFVEDWQTRSGA